MLRRAVLDERWTVLWYALGVALYAVVVLQFWPVMRKNTELLDRYISQFPEAMLKAFGVTNMTTIEGFLGAELLNFMWPLMASVFVIMAAAGTVGGEIDRGTVELWLCVPESRWRLLSAKLVALVLGVAALVAATSGAIALGVFVVGERVSLAGLVACAVVLAAFCMAVGGYTAFLSALTGARGRAAGMAAAVTLASYLLSVLSAIGTEWEWLRYGSIMSASHPQAALASGRVEPLELAALLGVGLVSSILALVVFERRDVAP